MAACTEWQGVAEALADALSSFLAYDGYGHGGADDSNRGDWCGAEKAMRSYREQRAQIESSDATL